MTHSLAKRHAIAHQVSAIRGSMMETPDSLRDRRAKSDVSAATAEDTDPARPTATPGPARVLALPVRGPRRDGGTRLGAIVPLDDSNRASVKKLAALLGWGPTDALVATITGATALVRPGKPTRAEPWLSQVQLDAGGRLTVPPAVKAALQLATGDQVVACAVAETGVLHLAAAADVLQNLSGEVPHTLGDQPSEPPLGAGLPRTRIKRAVAIAD